MRYLVTRMSNGSIVDFGFLSESDSIPEPVAQLIRRDGGVKAVTLDMDNGTRVRYEL